MQAHAAIADVWDLDRLFADLAAEKKRLKPTSEIGLTATEQDLLCLLLAQNDPAQIAKKQNRSYNSVKSSLSQGLYTYITALTHKEAIRDWRDVWIFLDEKGYKRAKTARNTVMVILAQKELSQEQIDTMIERMREITDDATLRLLSIKSGSIILVLDTSSFGAEQLVAQFQSGELSDRIGVVVQAVEVQEATLAAPISESVHLSQWWQHQFTTYWYPLAAWLSPREPMAARFVAAPDSSICRAKQLALRQVSVVLAVAISTQPKNDATNVAIRLRVYPVGESTFLPVGLQLSVLDELGHIIQQLQARATDEWLQIGLSGSPEERFQVRLTLENESINEWFTI